jgi:hypothetical protein
MKYPAARGRAFMHETHAKLRPEARLCAISSAPSHRATNGARPNDELAAAGIEASDACAYEFIETAVAGFHASRDRRAAACA